MAILSIVQQDTNNFRREQGNRKQNPFRLVKPWGIVYLYFGQRLVVTNTGRV